MVREALVQTPASSGTGPDHGPGTETAPARALNEASLASQQIDVEIERTPDAVIVHVTGEIDLLTSNYLGERLREQLEPANRVLVLNLTAVSFLGSAGLAEIVAASQASGDSGCKLVLVATNRAVLRPLEVTGLSSLLSMYDSVDTALAANG
jgi:anti-sigma B factor antagonist